MDVNVSLYVISKILFIVWSRECNTEGSTVFMKNRLGLECVERF